MRFGSPLRLAALVSARHCGRLHPCHPLSISGVAGFLSEWQLSGTLTETGTAGEFTTNLDMKHVGLCSQNGPEEKVTEMKLWLTGSRSWLARAKSEVRATFVMDGTICTLNEFFQELIPGSWTVPAPRACPSHFRSNDFVLAAGPAFGPPLTPGTS